MDSYEKRYKEALNKAKAAYGTGAYDDQTLEAIFPEITESEDERMLREFNDYLCVEIEARTNDIRNEKDRRTLNMLCYVLKKVDAYLEKQKEHQNNSDARENALGRDLTFPQDKDKNLDEIAQDYVDGVKEYNSEPTWDLMQTAVCYGYHYREQKEQKSDTRTADDLHLLGFIYDLLASLDWRENYAMSKEECLRRLNDYRPQKPAEWDEYTKMNLDRALQIIKKAKGTLQGYQSDDGIYECDKAIECLEHFLYRGLEIEKPAEWSEEDEKMLEEIINHIYTTSVQRIPARPGSDIGKSWIKFLKSLRPQPKIEWSEKEYGRLFDIEHYLDGTLQLSPDRKIACIDFLKSIRPSWKPSEEQMKALERASTNKYLSAKQFDILVSLHEDLKKLI